VDLVKRTYSHRSEFVHHGAKPDDAILIERFLALVWKFYVLRLPRALDVFSATRAFVDSLDRMKYSA